MKNITTAIFGKLAGSSFNTDIGGRLYKGRAPQEAEYPYAVYSVVIDRPADTFKDDLDEIEVQFSLYSSKSSTTEIETMYADLKALYDDCSLTPTGATLIWMVRQNAAFVNEEHTTPEGTQEVYAYYVQYSVYQQRTA